MPNKESKTAKRKGEYKEFSHPWPIDTEPEHDVSTADNSSLGSERLRPNELTNNFTDEQIQHIQSLVSQIVIPMMVRMTTASGTLNLILKGVPSEINTTYILDDLKLKGFSVTKIYRLKSDSDMPIDEVVFQLPLEEYKILCVSCCLGFPVTIQQYNDDFSQVEARSVLNQKFEKYFMNAPINVLIKAVPVDILENDVVEDLKRKCFQPIAVHRMVKYLPRGETRPLPMLLVQVHREESYIYKLKCLLGFAVTVETFFSHLYTITQCTECHQFGHDKVYCPGKKAKAVRPSVSQDITSVLNVVIQVPLQYEDDEFIMTHLKNNGFNPVAVKRIGAGPIALPYYLVQIPQGEKRIMQWSCCLGYGVIVVNYMPDQCEYCKQFDHTQETCHVKDEDEFQRPQKRPCGFKESTQEKFGIKLPEADKNIYSEDDITSEAESEAAVYKTKPKEMKDASTNTTVYIPLNTMTQNFKTYANIMGQFKTKLGSFAKLMDEYYIDTSNLAPFVSTFENLFDLHGTTLPILDAMICVMKSITGLIMDMPDLPGVTSHTLNEQLHTIEKLEELKVVNRTYSSRFTVEYDEQFPKLEGL